MKKALVVREHISDKVVNEINSDQGSLVLVDSKGKTQKRREVTTKMVSEYLAPILDKGTTEELEIADYRQVIEVFGFQKKGGLGILKGYLKELPSRNGAVKEMLDHAGNIEVMTDKVRFKKKAHRVSIIFFKIFGGYPTEDQLVFLVKKIPLKDCEELLAKSKGIIGDFDEIYIESLLNSQRRTTFENDDVEDVDERDSILESYIDTMDDFVDFQNRRNVA